MEGKPVRLRCWSFSYNLIRGWACLCLTLFVSTPLIAEKPGQPRCWSSSYDLIRCRARFRFTRLISSQLFAGKPSLSHILIRGRPHLLLTQLSTSLLMEEKPVRLSCWSFSYNLICGRPNLRLSTWISAIYTSYNLIRGRARLRLTRLISSLLFAEIQAHFVVHLIHKIWYVIDNIFGYRYLSHLH